MTVDFPTFHVERFLGIITPLGVKMPHLVSALAAAAGGKTNDLLRLQRTLSRVHVLSCLSSQLSFAMYLPPLLASYYN